MRLGLRLGFVFVIGLGLGLGLGFGMASTPKVKKRRAARRSLNVLADSNTRGMHSVAPGEGEGWG